MTSAFLIDAYNNSMATHNYVIIHICLCRTVGDTIDERKLHSTNNAKQYTHSNVTSLQYTVLGLQQKSEETFLFTLRMKESTSFTQ